MSNPTFPIHPHPHGLMSNRNQCRLRRQQAGATASPGGPVFVSPQDQFLMSLDTFFSHSVCGEDMAAIAEPGLLGRERRPVLVGTTQPTPGAQPRWR
jgi:hypothetical protein